MMTQKNLCQEEERCLLFGGLFEFLKKPQPIKYSFYASVAGLNLSPEAATQAVCTTSLAASIEYHKHMKLSSACWPYNGKAK